MSRLTGTDVLGLFEAYQTIYSPQELTEEQVWEEVEIWVNSLIEEGYDLSDYTWEEMYESYLEEAPARNYGDPNVALLNKQKATRSTAQKQVQTALGQGKGIDVRGATSGAAQGRGFGAVSGGRQGVVVNKPLKPGETQQINVGGRTLFPAKSGNRTVYLPSKDAKPATPLFKSSTKPVPSVDKDKPVQPNSEPQQDSGTGGGSSGGTGGGSSGGTGGGSSGGTGGGSGPVLSKKDGVEGTGVGADFKEKAFTAAEKSRYASVAAKNAAVSPGGTPPATSKPTAASQLSPGGRASNSDLGSKTFPKRKTAGGTEYEVRTPTRAEMEASRKAGGGEAGVKSAVERSSKLMGGPEGPGEIKPDPALKSITKSFSPKPTPTPTPAATAPSPVNRATGSKKPGSIVSGFDMFDVVKGYLIGEGYADTEESALAIMANMSEEWRESIVLDERNRGEQGMSDREVSRRRNLGGNTRSTVSSDALGDHGSQGAIQKFHNRKGKLRQAIHKSGRNTRGDTGESGGKGRYEANKDHTDGYPSITKRGQGPG